MAQSKRSETPPTDATLVRRSLAGDQGAFVELVKRHEQPLAALIRYRIDDLHHAEDVFQETLLQAWRSLCQLRDPTKVRAWLLQVARNRCRDFLKSSQRRHRPTDEQTLSECLNRYGRTSGRPDEVASDVVESLERVPAAQREVAKMFYLRGLTMAEIARRIRRPEGTVKRRLFHAREHLRRAFGVASKAREKRDE